MPARNVKFLGLGGGGGKITAGLTATGTISASDVVVADTDGQALQDMGNIPVTHMGEDWTNGQGCGGDTSLGEKAVSASTAALREVVDQSDMLFIIAALGGGTGGAVRIIAQLAREAGTMTMFLVTLPFSFEGNWRRRVAHESLDPLQRLVDTVIVIPNDLLFTALNADTPVREAFCLADTLLAESLACLSRIAAADGLIPADYARFRRLLKERPATCLLGMGRGAGQDRSQQAVESLLECPLLGGPEKMQHADAAIVSVLGGPDVAVGEMQRCLGAVQQYLPEDIRLVVGAYTIDDMPELQITALLCNYEKPTAPEPVPEEKPSKQTTGKRKKKGDSRSHLTQAELPLQEQTLGIFSGSAPSLLRGENLDIPTFQRKGIRIDTGDF